jgi:hypothetical protein
VTSPAESDSPTAHAAGECGWCPLCRLVAGLRAENPEALTKVLTAASAFAAAVHELFEPTPDTGEPAAASAPAAPSAPRVQHIDLDTEAAS